MFGVLFLCLVLCNLTTQGNPQQITGVLQLYAVELKKSQPVMDAPAACFMSIVLDGRAPEAPSTLFCFTMRDPNTGGFRVCECLPARLIVL